MNIYKTIDSEVEQKGSINIALSGATCSGKTTLAKKIEDDFSGNYSVLTIKQDDYFKDLIDFPRGEYWYLTDTPSAFHVFEFRKDVNQLLKAFKTTVPRYNILANTRIAKDKKVELGQINIFEGLHTISLLNDIGPFLKVFLNTNINTCQERRVNRDISTYGVSKDRVEEIFKHCILPMYYKFILPQSLLADFVINDNKF